MVQGLRGGKGVGTYTVGTQQQGTNIRLLCVNNIFLPIRKSKKSILKVS